MAALGQIFKVLTTIAALYASIETIIRLAKFAWSLIIQITKRVPMAPLGAAFRFARA